jgi:hypothetical protein
MKQSTRQTSFKTSPLTLLVICATLVFFNSSCNQKTKFSFLKLDSASLARYYNAPNFSKIVFQFAVPDLNDNNDAMKLVGYALDKDYNMIGDPFVLAYASDSSEKTFKGSAIYGNLEFTKTKIDGLIRGKDSSIISYQYLLFQPVLLPSRQINYNVDSRPAGVIVMGQGSTGLNPSPPAKPGIMIK